MKCIKLTMHSSQYFSIPKSIASCSLSCDQNYAAISASACCFYCLLVPHVRRRKDDTPLGRVGVGKRKSSELNACGLTPGDRKSRLNRRVGVHFTVLV